MVDKIRHHSLFEALANAIKHSATGLDLQPRIPTRGPLHDKPNIRTATERLLELEGSLASPLRIALIDVHIAGALCDP